MTEINENNHALYPRYSSVFQDTVTRINPPLQSHTHHMWLKITEINKYKEKNTKEPLSANSLHSYFMRRIEFCRWGKNH